MKFGLLFAVIMSATNFCTGQVIVEHIQEYNKSFNPLFSVQRGSMKIKLDLVYRYPNLDSTMLFIIDIAQLKVKLEGISNSMSSGGSTFSNYGLLGGIMFASNRSYSLTNTNGVAYLSRESFDSLVGNVEIINEFSKFAATPSKSIVFKAGKLYTGAELRLTTMDNKVTTDRSFYVQVDDSIYKLSESDFTDFRTIIREIKQTWDTYNKTKSVSIYYNK